MLRSSRPRRVLSTVLFTDIVGSTALAEELGDARWRGLLADHHRVVRRLLRRHRGREVDTAGDGFFATFAQPADAIACALEAADAVGALGIQVRAGIHTGEVEPMGAKVGGIAVHLGARILGIADPGQIVVSSTVRDLVSGAGFSFVDLGSRSLKGMAEGWHLWAVVRPAQVDEERDTAPRSRVATILRRWGLRAAGLVAMAAVSAAAAFVVFRAGDTPSVGANQLRAVRPDGSLGDGHAVGRGPATVTVAGDALWVVNTFGGTVSRIDRIDGQDAVVGVGVPTDLAVAADLIWVLDPYASTVSIVSPADGRLLQSLDVHGRAIDATDAAVWVADDLQDVVHRIDPRTRSVQSTIALPAGSGPSAIAATTDAVWVVNLLSGTLSRIDPVTNAVTVEAVALTSWPTAVAAGPDAVWVASEFDDVVIGLDPASNRVIRQAPSCDGPVDLAIAGADVVVACSGDRAMWRIPAEGAEPIVTQIDGVPAGLVVDGDEVWVTIRES